MLIFPSHGRGRRFNPYSAHHFTGVFCPRLGTTLQNTARTGKVNVEKSLNFVRGAFASFGAFERQSELPGRGRRCHSRERSRNLIWRNRGCRRTGSLQENKSVDVTRHVWREKTTSVTQWTTRKSARKRLLNDAQRPSHGRRGAVAADARIETRCRALGDM